MFCMGGYGALINPSLSATSLYLKPWHTDFSGSRIALGELIHNVINMDAQLVGRKFIF